ncbi:hypothetical protein PM10SUCC1_38220 [Propionigenium maris DSM 9537]|uniref:Helix-turn-helix domain-containing protein n=1 Tax=Propionigenium maris DSM 9537 TaxID=1123000 RepID=A0A9W6LPW0_9FUSO|nr:helix-turn-helix domain-containing protein [Propionigenium maris]GLI58308.1 hypothetical protein PM10SUCC1_38220 [Propionigenium maris DSM 9537]
MEVRQFVGTIFEDGFGMIPQRIMRDRKLSSNGKVVYSYLASYAWNTTRVYPKQKTMSEDLGISEEKLRKCLKELYDLGYVQKEKYLIPEEDRTSPKQRYRNVYILTNSLKEIIEIKDKRVEEIFETTENIEEFEPPCFEGVQNEPPQSEAPQNKGVNNKRITRIKETINKKTTTKNDKEKGKIHEVENVDHLNPSDTALEKTGFYGVENVDSKKNTTSETQGKNNYKNYVKEILKECGFESLTKGTVKNILALSPTYDRLREVLAYVKINEMGEGAIVKALRDEWVTREPKRRLPKKLSREDKISLAKSKLGMDRVKQIREGLVEKYKRYQGSPSFDRHISRELDEKLCKLYSS